jgi:hypothetical protein
MKTERNRLRYFAFGALAVVVVLTALAGCGEKDVPFVVDADEIVAYVKYSPEAKELFRVEGLFPSKPYWVAHQNAIYIDRVLKHERRIYADLVPLYKVLGNDSVRTPNEELFADYDYLGFLREAWAEVVDEFEIETKRIKGADTLIDTTDRELYRYGFFLKLGADYQPYVGWQLYGFNGIGNTIAPIRATVITADDSTFTGDLLLYKQRPKSSSSLISHRPYIKLSDLPRIPVGSDVVLFTDWAGSQSITKRDYPLVNLESDSGFITTTLGKNSRDNYSGIVNLRDGSTRRYDFLHMQSFHDDEFFHTFSWVIPFRYF